MKKETPNGARWPHAIVRVGLLGLAAVLMALFSGFLASPAQAGEGNPVPPTAVCKGCCPTSIGPDVARSQAQTGGQCVLPPVFKQHTECCTEMGHTTETVSVYNPNATVLDVRVWFDNSSETVQLKAHEVHNFVFMHIKNGTHTLKIEYCVNGVWCELCKVIIKTWCPTPSHSPSASPTPSPSQTQTGTLTGATPPVQPASLPVTGGHTGVLIGAGVLLVLAGVGLVLMAWRQNRDSA